MTAARMQMLIDLMALEFTAVELNLYLDTHPHDQRALNAFNAAVEDLGELKREYEARFGPLTNFGYSDSGYPWRWVEEPWPWQINFIDLKGV